MNNIDDTEEIKKGTWMAILTPENQIIWGKTTKKTIKDRKQTSNSISKTEDYIIHYIKLDEGTESETNSLRPCIGCQRKDEARSNQITKCVMKYTNLEKLPKEYIEVQIAEGIPTEEDSGTKCFRLINPIEEIKSILYYKRRQNQQEQEANLNQENSNNR
jgi:hypothetical protein